MLTRRIKTYHSPIDDKWYNALGSYCCVDCDGDYESYYTCAKKYYIKDITNKYRRNIIAELLEMKPHNKNKTGKLENEYSSLI